MFQFHALSSGRFHRGFHRVNLHRPTRAGRLYVTSTTLTSGGGGGSGGGCCCAGSLCCCCCCLWSTGAQGLTFLHFLAYCEHL